MAAFNTKCPHCNAELQVQEEWIGMEVECPMCKDKFVIDRSSENKLQDNMTTQNSLNRKRWYVLCFAIVAIISITVIGVVCFNSNENGGSSVQAETSTIKKPKRAGLYFSFEWGYLLDDLDKTEFKSLTKISDFGYVEQYQITTKNDYQYGMIIEKSSRKIQTIMSEDQATIKAFIAEVPSILNPNNKAKENEIASCYYIDGVDDDVLLSVSKSNENKKMLVIEKSIWNSEIEKYFNATLKSF